MKRISIFLIATLFTVVGFAQNTGFKTALKLGDEAFGEKNYYTAVYYYMQVFDQFKESNSAGGAKSNTSGRAGTSFPYRGPVAVKKNYDFATYKYVIGKIAESYYNYRGYADAEIWYAKICALEEYEDVDNMLNYATTLRANEKYDEAIVMFRKARKNYESKIVKDQYGRLVEDEASKAIFERIDFELECCEFAIEALKTAYVAKPTKLDTELVNVDGTSNYAAAIFSEDKLLFTTTRERITNPTSKRKGAFNNSFMTYDLAAKRLMGLNFGFGIDKNVGAPTLTEENDFIFFTVWSTEPTKPEYEIYMSRPLNDSIWEEARPLNDIVNQKGIRAMYPYVTRDGKGLYFCSDRPEGFGGLDIYYVRLDDKGQPVGRVMNMGPSVNSKRDDITPYYDEAAGLMYFASNGWVGMGGFDIFVSQLLETKEFQVARNLGYPINSSKDDAYLTLAEKGNLGYFASDRKGGCCYELYETELNLFVGRGQVVDAFNDQPLSGVSVVCLDSTETIELANTVTDSLGYFTVMLQRGVRYDGLFTKGGYLDNDQIFYTEEAQPLDTLNLGIVKMIPIQIGKITRLDDILYDFDKATLRPSSMIVLDKLAKHLMKFPYLVVEIGSHTDSKGTAEYNNQLSQMRSQSVVDYLVSKGIAPDAIVARGYGESVPKVPNTNPDGSDSEINRQINRRTEFKILEYRMERKVN